MLDRIVRFFIGRAVILLNKENHNYVQQIISERDTSDA